MNTVLIQETRRTWKRKPQKKQITDFQTQYRDELNLVSVRGWSMGNQIVEKYNQLLSDIQRHLEFNDALNVYFRYETFNVTTLRYLFKILKVLDKAYAKGQQVKIYWSCLSSKESDMIETGIELSNMCDFEFNISYM